MPDLALLKYQTFGTICWYWGGIIEEVDALRDAITMQTGMSAMGPIVRFIKHVVLAVLVIIAAVCVAEVGLRANRLHNEFSGLAPQQASRLGSPCPITFQHLPVNQQISYWSSEIGAPVEISTNSLGLRGPEVPTPKPPGRYRIVCLGDEATLAPDIPESESFCGSLTGMLAGLGPDVEVINAGQPGHCPLLNLAWSRSRLIGLQPDLVILCCDVSDVADDRRCRPLAKFSDDGQILTVSNPSASSHDDDFVSAIEREFMLVKLVSDHFGEQLAADSFDDNSAESLDDLNGSSADHPTVLIEQTWEPLAGLRELCRQISAEFVVAVVPSRKTVDSVASTQGVTSMSPGTSEVLRLLGERASLEQIPLLDASTEFAAHENQSRLFLPLSGALSAEGHQLFAHILGNALLERHPSSGAPVAVPVGAEVLDDAPIGTPTKPLPTLDRRRRPRPTTPSFDGSE